LEPIQDLVCVLLETDDYVVRSNTRYKVPHGYSDLDIIAVKLDPTTGEVKERIWGEVKAHMEHTLTPGYLRALAREYSSLLDLDKFAMKVKEMKKLRARQAAADEAVHRLLGPTFKQVLYYAGPRARDDGKGALELLRPGIEIAWMDDMLRVRMDEWGHLEGDEPLVRLMTTPQGNGTRTWCAVAV